MDGGSGTERAGAGAFAAAWAASDGYGGELYARSGLGNPTGSLVFCGVRAVGYVAISRADQGPPRAGRSRRDRSSVAGGPVVRPGVQADALRRRAVRLTGANALYGWSVAKPEKSPTGKPLRPKHAQCNPASPAHKQAEPQKHQTTVARKRETWFSHNLGAFRGRRRAICARWGGEWVPGAFLSQGVVSRWISSCL